MATQKVVEAVTKRKFTADEWDVLLENRIPELIRQCKAEALDPTGVNASLQFLIEGSVITSSKEVLVVPPKPKSEKFAFFEDIGVITVPADYDHKKQLDSFMQKNRKKFYDVNEDITDANFLNPSRILKPGDKFAVTAFKQIVRGTTTSKERMDFLCKQPGNVLVGPQGNSLVFEQLRDKLPKGFWYVAFDEEENCWKDSPRGHSVNS